MPNQFYVVFKRGLSSVAHVMFTLAVSLVTQVYRHWK